jgi:hypothetical protein
MLCASHARVHSLEYYQSDRNSDLGQVAVPSFDKGWAKLGLREFLLR